VQDLIENFKTLEWLTNLLDIGLVSYLIYRTLLLIKGTRAVRMLVGILLLIVLFFLSKDQYLSLPTLNWLLDQFIASFIIIVIVVFQEDIRRALSEVGRNPIVQAGRSVESEGLIGEIVGAVVRLSSHKIGALIAIERDGDLSTYTEEGIALDAEVSAELLFSLFSNKQYNPLHDGAVIIQKGRVSHAACFLPLTVSPNVSRDLGTRHRAAIGLSEETDACVIAVSEETGTISVALFGELTRGYDEASLGELLSGTLGHETRSTLWRRLQRIQRRRE
jgi:uncharacterized protein (TIGR00159 family)